MSDTGADLPGWKGILEPGEQILWQGRPERPLRFQIVDGANAVQGLLMVGFGIFWIWMLPGFDLLFIAAGLFIIGLGLRQIIGPVLSQAVLLRHSFYTLTDRRALVATDLPVQGRRLATYPISFETPATYLPSEPPSILFGPPVHGRKKRPGFMYIPDADQVIEMMRKIERSQIPDQTAPKDSQP